LFHYEGNMLTEPLKVAFPRVL